MIPKRRIAREGLFLLLLIFGIGFLLLANYEANVATKLTDLFHAEGGSLSESAFQPELNLRHISIVRSLIFSRLGFWLVVAYCVIGIIRFVWWATKTLSSDSRS